MTLYFFNVHGNQMARDEEGAEFPDLESAIASAVAGARELMSDEVKNRGQLFLGHWIAISDVDGALLHVTKFRDCVTIWT